MIFIKNVEYGRWPWGWVWTYVGGGDILFTFSLKGWERRIEIDGNLANNSESATWSPLTCNPMLKDKSHRATSCLKRRIFIHAPEGVFVPVDGPSVEL
jgi:ATP-dependent Lon protease